MTGACREDWNAMHPTREGRFCGKCQHAVVDFSGWDRSAVLAYKRAHPEACGLYRAEHLEPHLVPLSDLLKPARGLMAAGLAFGALTVSAQVPPTAPTEQTEPIAAPTHRPDIAPEYRPDHPIPGMDSEAFSGICPLPDRPARTAKHHRFHRLYVSKRFPFIHFRRPRVMGKFAYHTRDNMLRVTGTPSF